MLLNKFFTYTVTEQSESLVLAEVSLRADHEIYKGHFPNLPVTPGVCQVQIVQEILNDVTKKNYCLKSARDIKFLNFIDPQKTREFTLELKLKETKENDLSVNALLSKEGLKYLKMRSVFAAG